MGVFFLELISGDFQNLLGTKWDQDSNFDIDARDARSGSADFLARLDETHCIYGSLCLSFHNCPHFVSVFGGGGPGVGRCIHEFTPSGPFRFYLSSNPKRFFS